MAARNVTITVLPATEDDVLALAQIESMAFSDHEDGGATDQKPVTLGTVMFGPPTAAGQAFRAKEFAKNMKSMPELRLFKAVVHDHESNEETVAGLASWKFYTDPLPTEDGWKDKAWKGAKNPQACNDFFGKLSRSRTNWMGGKRFAWLEVLGTHPDFQGMGIGTKLLRMGLDNAEKLGLDVAYLEATRAGYPLYKKFGWEGVEEIPLDMARYGGEGIWLTTCMVRKSNSAS